ncbi:MAG: hypothetical protein Q4P25_03185, partial [Tissierellia bacterium]|nr:hypothetical protein [Tissierellia bacterium]
VPPEAPPETPEEPPLVPPKAPPEVPDESKVTPPQRPDGPPKTYDGGIATHMALILAAIFGIGFIEKKSKK